jgi:hypothetical protein
MDKSSILREARALLDRLRENKKDLSTYEIGFCRSVSRYLQADRITEKQFMFLKDLCNRFTDTEDEWSCDKEKDFWKRVWKSESV